LLEPESVDYIDPPVVDQWVPAIRWGSSAGVARRAEIDKAGLAEFL
jgi:hypothetical protein